MIYADCEHIEEALSAVPGRGGPVFPTRLHLLRLYYDPVMGTRGVDGGHTGANIWHKHQTAVRFSGTDASLAFWPHG